MTTGRPRRKTGPPKRLNYDKFGGLASIDNSYEASNDFVEEPLVENLTTEHITNQCRVYMAAFGIDCPIDVKLSEQILLCLSKLDELPPHAFAEVFKASNKKNPDILSYDEVLADIANRKAWLEAALKEIKQLEAKKVWVECLKTDANGEQIVPCTWVF